MQLFKRRKSHKRKFYHVHRWVNNTLVRFTRRKMVNLISMKWLYCTLVWMSYLKLNSWSGSTLIQWTCFASYIHIPSRSCFTIWFCVRPFFIEQWSALMISYEREKLSWLTPILSYCITLLEFHNFNQFTNMIYLGYEIFMFREYPNLVWCSTLFHWTMVSAIMISYEREKLS